LRLRSLPVNSRERLSPFDYIVAQHGVDSIQISANSHRALSSTINTVSIVQ
jgi:hypothetical protein